MMSKEANRRAGVESSERACGLCGNTGELTKTECCDNWICDDEHKYASSPSHATCYRNHKKYTLCAFHHDKGHEGKWQECIPCIEEFDQDDYEVFASGEYNFECLDEFLACGMCGNTRGLTKTECCKNWICYKDCYFNHWKYSLCAFHHGEGHEGKWRECIKCKDEFSEENYEEFASAEYNFEEWEDAP